MSLRHVIVGGLGNLGRHLQRVLLEQGKTVVVIDKKKPLSVVEELLCHPSVQYIPYTFGSSASKQYEVVSLQTALTGADTVYSAITPNLHKATNRQFYQVNHRGIVNLISACRSARVPKLVYGSSMAVMNHFEHHVEWDETHPLPNLLDYQTSYERTKRLGEDAVLQAAKNDSDDVPLQTCSLRFGGILSSPTDYMFQELFTRFSKTGMVLSMEETRPLDIISGWDCATAMAQASIRMDHVNGQALFCTKDKGQVAPRGADVAEEQGRLLGVMEGEFRVLPSPLVQMMSAGMAAQHYSQFAWKSQQDVQGFPMHLLMKVPLYEQTFNNRKAHDLLDWFPEYTWQETVAQIIKQYRLTRLETTDIS